MSDGEQEEREELPPMTADDNGTPRGLSEGSDDDEPGTSAKRAKDLDGQPRRVRSEVPPVSLPIIKVFERDADGSVELDYQIPLTFATPPHCL